MGWGKWGKWLILAGLLLSQITLWVTPPTAAAQSLAANTCTISVAPGTYVTMGDGNALLAFTVTNHASSAFSIDTVQLGFDASIYDLSAGLNAPQDWKILSKESGSGQTWIRYSALTAGARIAPGRSLTFYVPLIGRSNGQFPAAPNDQTDILNAKYTSIEGGGQSFLCTPLPTWPRKSLAVKVTALPLSLPVGQAIRVELLVANRSTITQNGITTALNSSGSGGVSLFQGPHPPSIDLLAGAMRTQVYTYTATSPGNVRFTATASQGPWVTSGPASSDELWIGDWTASLELSALSAVNGQEIRVWMHVQNNTLPSAGNVRPTLTFNGSAAATLVQGPTPVKINSIPPGSVGTFEWVYRITGAIGQTYSFQGYATDKDGRTTNTASSPTGTLGRYVVHPSPERVASGSTNTAIAFTVYNRGATVLDEAVFTIPPGWVINEAASGGGYNGAWNKNYNPGKRTMTFTSPNAGGDLPAGASATFTLYFNSVPTVSADTVYDFGTALANNGVDQGGDIPTVLVTRYKVTLSAAPTTLPADGASSTTLTACITEAGIPVRNVWVNFTTTAGTLAAPVAQTGSNGCATMKLTAPISVQTINATASADYLTAEGNVALIFTGFNNANPLYVGGTLAPITGQPGQTVALTLDVINLGTRDITLSTASVIRLTDGTRVYQATLSAPVAIPVDARRSLNFVSATIDPAFTPGAYYPVLLLSGVVGGAEVQFERPVTDPFAIGAAALQASLSATPSLVLRHMDVTVVMTVRNYGLYPAYNVTPSALIKAGSGSVNLLSGPTPASVATLMPGEETTFTWAYRATGIGQVTWSGQATGTDSASGAPISSATATSNVVTIARGGELSAAFSGPAAVNVGQGFSIQLNVTNSGDVAVNTIVPSPPGLLGDGSVTELSGPEPANLLTLAPGESGTFVWTYQALGPGTLSWNGDVSGVDSVSGQTIGSIVAPHLLTIQNPAALSCALQARPLIAPTGHTVYMTMTVTNSGEASAVGVAPSPLTTGGSGAVTLLDGPFGAPVTIPGRSSRQFTWQYRATHSGTATWRGFAQGTDGNTGATVNSAPCDSNSITIQPAAYLISTLMATPEAVGQNESVTVRMRVDNVGEVEAQNVTPSPLILSDGTLFSLTGGPTPATANLAAGQSITFTWTYRSANNKTGVNTWRGNATGRDALTGAMVSSAATTSNEVYVYDVVPEKVARTSAPGYAQPNETFLYEITLRNTSNQAVILQTLRDTLPAGVSYVETVGATVTPLPPSISGQNVTWTWSDTMQAPIIPARSVFTLTFKARVGTTPGTYCNTVAFTRQGGSTTLRTNLACFTLGWQEYFIITQAGDQRIRVRVRLVNRRPIILSWEYLP